MQRGRILAMVALSLGLFAAQGAQAFCLFNCSQAKTKYPIVLAHGMSGFDDLAECERKMRRHAAQTLFRHDGPAGSEVIESEQDRKEHLEWARWQRSYRAARERGLSDEEARRIA